MVEWIINHQTLLVVWMGAVCTLALYSLLYRENVVYTIFEHVYIGLAAGYTIFIVWSEYLKPLWWDRIFAEGRWLWTFGLVVGSMFYFIYVRKHAWISRLVFGFFMGLGAGGSMKAFVTTYIPQIQASFKPVYGHDLSAPRMLNNILFIVILLTVMSYFFFSIEHRAKSIRYSAGVGRWFLMFAFGAMFGSTVMARMSLLIGRVYFLLSDWIPVIRR